MNTHINPTSAAASEAGLRNTISNEIERLIELLDAMDGDPDFEETGDENDTGIPDGWRGSSLLYMAQIGYASPILEDEEDGNDTEQDDADSEPVLGWTNAVDQTAPARNMSQCGHSEDEPELGWCGNGNGWQDGEPLEEEEDELEFDQGESGIADSDGMADMWGSGSGRPCVANNFERAGAPNGDSTNGEAL